MKIDFDKGNGLVPAIVQDANTHKVLMLGYMNQDAYKKTRQTGRVTFYSRSRQELWTKGETSGNYLYLQEIRVDCDNDTLLIKAHPSGSVCHTGKDTCFEETNISVQDFIHRLENIIADRQQNPQAGSYTCQLFDVGIKKISQKVGEEAVEVIIDALDDNINALKEETADLLYHLLVLLRARDIDWDEIMATLAERHK